MAITAQDVKRLREATGVGIMDAKQALEASGGDFDKAVEALRKSGAAKAAKKADRAANEGMVFSYLHPGGQIGVLVELNSETDFVARNEQFQALGADLALHIAAMNPQYLRREDVPTDLVAKEREIVVESNSAKASLDRPEVLEKIVNGKLEKWYGEIVLLDQPFAKDDTKTVGELLTEAIQAIGENIQITRFARFAIKGNPSCSIDLRTE